LAPVPAIGLRLKVPPAVGVLAPVLGGGAFITLFARLGGADFCAFGAAGGGPAGVFDLGPGTGFGSEASSVSRYLSPQTKNGRPYSSSHFSKTFQN